MIYIICLYSQAIIADMQNNPIIFLPTINRNLSPVFSIFESIANYIHQHLLDFFFINPDFNVLLVRMKNETYASPFCLILKITHYGTAQTN